MPLVETNYPPPEDKIAPLKDGKPTFLIFYSSVEDGKMWCPHCRDVQGIIKSAFQGSSKPNGVITYIGSFAQWKHVPSHPARLKYGVRFVPTVIRLENGKETARVEKAGILDSDGFEKFLS
ncbi:hypothetical protein IAT40_003163 [Kwoniella sp. CBS 6097]